MDCGIGEAHGDQMATRECYVAMLEMDEQMTTMNIEERRVNVEPMEGLETISLDDKHSNRITHIGTQASPSVRNRLILFLRDNLDIFAWNHEDIPGIDPNIMVISLTSPHPFHSFDKERGSSHKKGTRP